MQAFFSYIDLLNPLFFFQYSYSLPYNSGGKYDKPAKAADPAAKPADKPAEKKAKGK